MLVLLILFFYISKANSHLMRAVLPSLTQNMQKELMRQAKKCPSVLLWEHPTGE